MIPKIIHYCWFGNGKMNALQHHCLKSWESLLPDYKIKRWDESNFDVNFCPYTASAYQQGKFAFVSDVCRLFALKQDGGIYLDMDMLLIKNLD
jgi:Mannosyltransferase OCH1 and related enzymes